MNVQDFSTKVAVRYGQVIGKENAALDPAMIAVIMQIVTQLIDMFKNCKKKPADVPPAIKNPSVWERIVVRQQAIATMGRREFRQNGGSELVDSVFAAGKDLTTPDVQKMFDEAD